MKKFLNLQCFVVLFGLFACFNAFADVVPVAVTDIPLDQFLGSLLQAIVGFFSKQPDGSDLSWAAKIAALLVVVVSSSKVSALRPYWDKLGNAKAWLAPVLAMIGGIVDMIVKHQPITLGNLLAFASAGVGAIALHELLDWVKTIPGLNKYIAMGVDLLESILKNPSPSNAVAALSVKTPANQ